jgi:hypothetical protein
MLLGNLSGNLDRLSLHVVLPFNFSSHDFSQNRTFVLPQRSPAGSRLSLDHLLPVQRHASVLPVLRHHADATFQVEQ